MIRSKQPLPRALSVPKLNFRICTTLEQWLARAVTAANADDIFAEG